MDTMRRLRRRHCENLVRCRVIMAVIGAVTVPLVFEMFGFTTWLRVLPCHDLVAGLRW